MNIINNKKFTSIDKKHSIDIDIINEIGWFQIIEADFQNYKTFFLLIKDCVEFLNTNNVKLIKQYIRKEDLKFIKESSYIETNNIYIITTPIDKFIPELTNLLGFKPL